MHLAPTARDTLWRNGTARLYRFRGGSSSSAGPVAPRGPVGSAAAGRALPVLVVPSLINRWYVLDLRPGASLVGALVASGLAVYCLDWGVPEDEDRYLGWEDVLLRLERAVRAVLRASGAPRLGLLGYCMGGTLMGIHAALHGDEVAALVNLAGPFDFRHAGALGTMVDPAWFDAGAIAAAGNVSGPQMQSGFVALRPTLPLAKWVGWLDRAGDAAFREGFLALEEWGNDNVAFPAAAYETYIQELYQKNALVRGEHHVGGKRVDLGSIRVPVLTIVASRDTICPPAAATALNTACGSSDAEVITVPGGHVGAVVGSTASRELYPALSSWLLTRLSPGRAPVSTHAPVC